MDIQEKFLEFVDLLFYEREQLNLLDKVEHADLEKIRSTLCEFINSIPDTTFAKKISYFSDEMLIKSLGTKWTGYLIERNLYKTNNGGEGFFDQLQKEIKNKDVNEARISAMMIKMGFKGRYEKIPAEFETGLYHLISPPFCAPKQYFYTPTENNSHVTIWNCFFICIISVFVIILIDIIKYKYLFYKFHTALGTI